MTKHIDLPLLEDMLKYIPADGSRVEWVKILMAIKSEFGEAGQGSALSWSERAASFKLQDFQAAWKSINAAGKTSIGSLIHQAKQNGFKFEPMSDDEKQRLALESAERAKRRAKELKAEEERIAAQHNAAREVAVDIWHNALDQGQSQYAKNKGITPYAAKYSKDGKSLIVPVYDEKGALWNTQTIHANGDKLFQKGGAKSGKMLIYPSQILSDFVLVTTGYATFCTLHQATGYQTVAAFDDGNLPKVIALIKKQRPDVQILICTDDDYLQHCRSCKQLTTVDTEQCQHCGEPHKQKNSGLIAARKAAVQFKCDWVAPQFPSNRNGETDFNDLANMQGGGLQIVAEQINAAIQNAGVQAKPATQAGVPQKGEGVERPQALSIMPIEDIVNRFIYVDDDAGETCFDRWTRKLVKAKKVQSLLPAKTRWDEIKSHPIWMANAVYLDQVGFDPTEQDENIKCNMWAGWPMQPRQGCCDNLLALIKYLCSGEDEHDDEALLDWVLRWLAYPLQNPGAKMQSAIVVHGPQGTGKSLFFEVIGKIYGEYGIVLNQGAIEDKFNSDWTSKKLYVVADEVVANAEKHHLKNQLKALITGEWIRVNPKNVAAHKEKNQMNMVFLSNEKQPVVLENDDRRHCIIWTPPKLVPEKYSEIGKEVANGGVEALYHFLLNINLDGFDTHTKPPMTKSKQQLIDVNRDTVDGFIQEWINDGLDYPFGPVLNSDLYAAYKHWCVQQGENYPRSQKVFNGHIDKLDGWYRGYKDRFENLNFEPFSKKRCRVVIPSDQACEQVKKEGRPAIQPQPNQSIAEYITQGVVAFETERAKR